MSGGGLKGVTPLSPNQEVFGKVASVSEPPKRPSWGRTERLSADGGFLVDRENEPVNEVVHGCLGHQIVA